MKLSIIAITTWTSFLVNDLTSALDVKDNDGAGLTALHGVESKDEQHRLLRQTTKVTPINTTGAPKKPCLILIKESKDADGTSKETLACQLQEDDEPGQPVGYGTRVVDIIGMDLMEFQSHGFYSGGFLLSSIISSTSSAADNDADGNYGELELHDTELKIKLPGKFNIEPVNLHDGQAGNFGTTQHHHNNSAGRRQLLACSSSADCDDGNKCNGIETCNFGFGSGFCVAGSVIPVCSDNNPCNGVETCIPATGGCLSGIPLNCDDGNPCNGFETCVAPFGCRPGIPIICDDGDPCNGLETCDSGDGTCLFGTPIDCSSDSPSMEPSSSNVPSSTPSLDPSNVPSSTPTLDPSNVPSSTPTSNPTESPTMEPTETERVWTTILFDDFDSSEDRLGWITEGNASFSDKKIKGAKKEKKGKKGGKDDDKRAKKKKDEKKLKGSNKDVYMKLTGELSSFEKVLDLSICQMTTVVFDFRTDSLEGGELLSLKLWDDGVGMWHDIKVWMMASDDKSSSSSSSTAAALFKTLVGAEEMETDTEYDDMTVSNIDTSSFTSASRIQFEFKGQKKKDNIYIDNVEVICFCSLEDCPAA